MQNAHSSACGKIILTGEYAVLFGYPGIAIPAPLSVDITFRKDVTKGDVVIQWDEDDMWKQYVEEIVNHCIALGSVPPGELTITNTIPLSKGMGSSTALIIAIAKCLLGEDCEEDARMIENALNPNNSGIDFAVIWSAQPIRFQKEKEPTTIQLAENILEGALLIDTGTPDQQTAELIEWVIKRKNALDEAFASIGQCSEQLEKGTGLMDIFPKHNAAQQVLGVVSDKGKDLIKKIEQEGGAAKVIGAGSRTGGSGMVLAINIDASKIPSEYTVTPLTP